MLKGPLEQFAVEVDQSVPVRTENLEMNDRIFHGSTLRPSTGIGMKSPRPGRRLVEATGVVGNSGPDLCRVLRNASRSRLRSGQHEAGPKQTSGRFYPFEP